MMKIYDEKGENMSYKYYEEKSHAKDAESNIPALGDYCVTGVEHELNTDHCFSLFHLWKLEHVTIKNEIYTLWVEKGWVASTELLKIQIGVIDKIYSAKESGDTINTGEKIEVEFRVTHNGSQFKLSTMPGKYV
ncbi:hypothetical protein ACWM9A_06140 [Acetobacter pasteurianus]